AYDPELADRPAMVVANKADLPDGRARLPEAAAAAKRRGLPFFALSAATGAGMREFLYALGAEVAQARAARPVGTAAPPATVAADPEVPISVVREGAGFRVLGDRPERWVAMTDLDNPQAVAYLQRRMRRAGVDDLLTDAGASPGDEVLVGDAAFEFTPDPLAGTRGRERPRRPGR
ncbi:MAG TPA: Obg family GTPase CgtA, partial [Actinomycetota bacterium]